MTDAAAITRGLSPAQKRVPIGAVYALAEAFTREWWDSFGGRGDEIIRAQHRRVIEVPRAEKLLRIIRSLPKVERAALASAIKRGSDGLAVRALLASEAGDGLD